MQSVTTLSYGVKAPVRVTNESYIRALFSLAEHCNFADTDERIRDRLISGMSDRELSRRIQLKSLEEDVFVNTVISMMRNVEIVNGRDSSGPSDVSRVRAPAQHGQPRQQRQAHQHCGVSSSNSSNSSMGVSGSNSSSSSMGVSSICPPLSGDSRATEPIH